MSIHLLALRCVCHQQDIVLNASKGLGMRPRRVHNPLIGYTFYKRTGGTRMTSETGKQRETVLSQQALVEMQKIEAIPMEESKPSHATQDVPDMSVGWYVTPQHTDHSKA